MAMKEKLRNQKESDHLNNNPSLNKKSQLHSRKGNNNEFADSV